MRSFENWTQEEVETTFGIEELDALPLLEEWISADIQANEHEKYVLEKMKKHLLNRVDSWNEDELKLFFIGPLVELADIDSPLFKAFTQRSFSTTINGIEIGGKVDFVIAKGKQKPITPFFCLHEYKQENRRDNDPLGQVLIAMVAAQHLNEAEMPILGAYISGRMWFFVVLQDKKYAHSNAFNASDEDIFQIFSILKKSKLLVESFCK